MYGDVGAAPLDPDTLQIDDGVSLTAWLAAVSTTAVDEEAVWRSYDEQAEQEEVLDEGVSFALALTLTLTLTLTQVCRSP